MPREQGLHEFSNCQPHRQLTTSVPSGLAVAPYRTFVPTGCRAIAGPVPSRTLDDCLILAILLDTVKQIRHVAGAKPNARHALAEMLTDTCDNRFAAPTA